MIIEKVNDPVLFNTEEHNPRGSSFEGVAMSVIKLIGSPARNAINETFKGREAWEIVSMTSMTILASIWLYNFIFQDESVLKRAKKLGIRVVRMWPSVRKEIDSKMKKLNEDFEIESIKRTEGLDFITTLPEGGLPRDHILKLVERYVYAGDGEWKKGRVSGCVYRLSEPELANLIKEVYGLASLTNPLHPDIFPGICKMEAEVVRITCRLFNGDEKSCGTMTTGGTESIMLACKAFRDYAREVKGIKRPEMIVPVTAHSAFDKAAQFLGIRVRTVPVNPDSYTVSINAVKRAINGNTMLLVCSAPNFPYGTMDNIEAISALGIRYDIPVHVDACLGGFLICFMRQAGYQVPEFDFRLPGVSSISADTHKYGYAPKGSSVIMYRNKTYLHHQFTITTDWPGGIYGSPTVNGSRAGGIIAACWATMMFFGEKGYVEATRQIIETTKFIERELRQTEGVYVFGSPATSVIALGSNDFEIFRLIDSLNNRGWKLNPLQFPSAVHICVTHVHTQSGVAQQFVNDVREDVAELLKEPSKPTEGMYAIYGQSQGIPDRSIVSDIIKFYIDATYFTPSETTSYTETSTILDIP